MPILRLHLVATRDAAFEFLLFGMKQARAYIFAGSFFGVLIFSKTLPLGSLPRYDFILIAALVLQLALLASRIESLLKAIVLADISQMG